MMRRLVSMSLVALVACGSSERTGGFEDEQNASPPNAANDGGPGSSGGSFGTGDAAAPSVDAATVTTTTIYANSDDALYSLDPATNAVTMVGKMSGADAAVTDCAVDEAGEVFVNTTATIYRASLSTGGVTLQKIASIAEGNGQRFYALAFVPAGVLGAGETLVGGDGNGEIWSIDPQSGATKDLGSFGPDKTNVFALSGDLVFYRDAAGTPTGLATIRSCKPGGSCTTSDDYLAGIDMNALETAWSSGTPAKSLLAGIYGGSSTSKGSGTGYGALYGLGAWQGTVFAFERASANNGVPALLTIDTSTGKGTMLSSASSATTFANGWSGACVTTKVTVTVPPPPAAPN